MKEVILRPKDLKMPIAEWSKLSCAFKLLIILDKSSMTM